MNKKAINEKYTDVVRSYLQMGMNINAQTMASIGTGEIAKVDFTDGKDIYRVMMIEENETVDGERMNYFISSINIRVRKYTGKEVNERLTFGLWNHEGELLYEQRFFEFEGNMRHTGWYSTNMSDVISAIDKHYTRCRNRRIKEDKRTLPTSANYIVLSWARKHVSKCKTATIKDIASVTRNRCGDFCNYVAVIKGKYVCVWRRNDTD